MGDPWGAGQQRYGNSRYGNSGLASGGGGVKGAWRHAGRPQCSWVYRHSAAGGGPAGAAHFSLAFAPRRSRSRCGC